MNKSIKIVKKYAKLRFDDSRFIDISVKMYESYDDKTRSDLLEEMKEYIEGVKNGTITPTVPKIPIKVFKNARTH